MRILIVEDHQKTANLLKNALEAENFIVDISKTGKQGLMLAKTNNYDLLILDFSLPDIKGDSLCQEIRKRKSLPILMLSANSLIENKVNLLTLGVDDYLTKPYHFSELLARVKALLRRPPKIEKEVYRVHGLIVNPEKRSIKKSGREIYLTKKEFSLLLVLIKNKGKIVSRAQLLEKAWDINADPFSNTIEAHIRNLRSKIDQNKTLIKTIPGRGYLLEE
ncbi:MAG: response regulator [Candidatus Moranbacteria bacterium]|nr:response regulator [Candidatus Moranbacteria bacterium]